MNEVRNLEYRSVGPNITLQVYTKKKEREKRERPK